MKGEFFISGERQLSMREKDQLETRKLVAIAKQDALARLPENASEQARARIENAVTKRLTPYIEEGKVIGRQITTNEYKNFAESTKAFLNVDIGAVGCSDGRIVAPAIATPRIAHVHRRIQGMPETRKSTGRDKAHVMEDPLISASIKNSIDQRRQAGKNPELVEFVGPHIFSADPGHGCGAAAAKVESMDYGAIKEYFDELGEGFYAFNKNAELARGKGTTFDLTHDAYSQGLIFGLKNAYDNATQANSEMFDHSKSLRKNLINMHNNKQILMTELLRRELKDEIAQKAAKKGVFKLNLKNAEQFAHNYMTIGTIAREITEEHEKTGFSWIPDALKQDDVDLSISKSPNAIRALAYTAVQNCVYTELGNIQPSKHSLLRHPEQLIRVGNIGHAFNRNTIPFIQVTPTGILRDKDLEGVKALHGLATKFLPDQGINLEEEARVIIVTGEYDESMYTKPEFAMKEKCRVESIVMENAAMIRNALMTDRVESQSIREGRTVVIPTLHKPDSREMTHVVTPYSNHS